VVSGGSSSLALVGKLEEIAGNTTDVNTESEINEFIQVILDSLH